MTPDRDGNGQAPAQAQIIQLSRYLRGRGHEDDPIPPSPAAAARKPPAPVCVEVISAQAGAAIGPDARAA